MKTTLKRIGAIALAALILTGVSASADAVERSYTYTYDYWGDVQNTPDFYTPVRVFTSTDLNLEKRFLSPQGMTVNGDKIYICDTGNNRIVELARKSMDTLAVTNIYESFNGNVSNNTFLNPTDLAISSEGNIFICDKGNGRVLKLDKNFNYLLEFSKPVDSSLAVDLSFQPSKLVVDDAERVYCIAIGINKGLIKYEADGTFSGFVGATPATYNFKDYIFKKFATQEQLARMDAFVPTEYDNVYRDKDGFIYACTGSVAKEDLRKGDADAIRKINLLGNDILVRNGVYYDGKFPVYGDLYMGDGGDYSGPSYFSDVTVFDNDMYVCLDKNRGRLFGYDDQGRLVFVCGGNGNMDGYFRNPLGIDHMGSDLLVLDQLDCAITLFAPTDFGKLVIDAMDSFDDGEYDRSLNDWQEVIAFDGNYDLAYIGIGRAHLRQKEYKTAMEYFELKYDDVNWSKAYRQYRKIWVEENIVPIVIVLLLLFLVPLSIGKVKSIKHEIEIADIFKDEK